MSPKMAAILDVWPFGGHKKTKKQNFQNRCIVFVERHTRKVHTKFQVSSMYSVQMNVPFLLLEIAVKVCARNLIATQILKNS